MVVVGKYIILRLTMDEAALNTFIRCLQSLNSVDYSIGIDSLAIASVSLC